MSNKEVKDFTLKLEEGLQIAEKRMLEEKALRGEDLIVSSDGKTIERIPVIARYGTTAALLLET